MQPYSGVPDRIYSRRVRCVLPLGAVVHGRVRGIYFVAQCKEQVDEPVRFIFVVP